MTRGSGCCSIVRVELELEKKRQTIHHSSQEKRAPRYGGVGSGVFEYDLDIRARLVHMPSSYFLASSFREQRHITVSHVQSITALVDKCLWS